MQVPSLIWELRSHMPAAAAKSLQSCLTLCDPIWQPTRFLCPWDFPGKSTGAGCHFLLQCMKGKSESEVSQSCPTLSDPVDCSLPGSSVHGIFQARALEWGAIAFSMPSSQKKQNMKHNKFNKKTLQMVHVKKENLKIIVKRNFKSRAPPPTKKREPLDVRLPL